MKAKELAKMLLKNPDMEIMILDSFNGAGCPRTINLGPTTQIITSEDVDDTVDCEEMLGQKVLVIGYGYY